MNMLRVTVLSTVGDSVDEQVTVDPGTTAGQLFRKITSQEFNASSHLVRQNGAEVGAYTQIVDGARVTIAPRKVAGA